MAQIVEFCHASEVDGIELVVTDLDGTLWLSDRELLTDVLNAWRTIESRGIGILVATGRRPRSTREALAAFGLSAPAVLLNGAIGISFDTGLRFHERPIAPNVGTEILGWFSALGLSPVVYVDSPLTDAYVSDHPSTHPGHIAFFGSDICVGDLAEVVVTEKVLAFGLVGVPFGPAESLADAVDEAECGEARVNPSFDFGGCALTVVDRGVSKWGGVIAYCASAGIDPRSTVAIGDGSNDVEMLENAGLSCSFDGANPSAVAAADHIVAPAGSGGWAELLNFI